MSRLQVPEDIAELAIGHQRTDLVARYNFDQAWRRRVEAFEKVSAHIEQVLNEPSGKVVTFAASRSPSRRFPNKTASVLQKTMLAYVRPDWGMFA